MTPPAPAHRRGTPDIAQTESPVPRIPYPRPLPVIDADLELANLDLLLGVQSTWTIVDVIAGRCNVNDALIAGPAGLHLLPAASGSVGLAGLGDSEQANILAVIEALENHFDFVIVDCAAGIGRDVQMFAASSHEVVVAATTDPTSLTDAYAVMKVLRRSVGRTTFRVVPTQVTSIEDARRIYQILASVSDRMLDINVDMLGWIPSDPTWKQAILNRSLAFCANPKTPASSQVSELARRFIKLRDNTRTGASSSAAGSGGAFMVNVPEGSSE